MTDERDWKAGETGKLQYQPKLAEVRDFVVLEATNSKGHTKIDITGYGDYILEDLISGGTKKSLWEVVARSGGAAVSETPEYRCANCGHDWESHNDPYEEATTKCWRPATCECQGWEVKL